eukprot:Gb_38942 [translate_table: standard]
MEDRCRNGDYCADRVQEFVDEKRKKRDSPHHFHHHYNWDYSNNDAFMFKPIAAKIGRNGDPGEVGKRLLLWRFVFYFLVLFSVFFTAGLFNDLLFPVGERFVIQAHHPQTLSSNAVGETVVDDSLVVQDLAILPEHVLVFVKTCEGCFSLQKNEYECVYGDIFRAPVISVDLKERGLQIVRCPHPPQQKSAEGLTLTINLKEKGLLVPSQAQYSKKFSWEMLVYEAVIEPDSVILFVKGLNLRRGKISDTDNLVCVFGSGLENRALSTMDFKRMNMNTMDFDTGVYKTKVLMAAQEVIRCETPKGLAMEKIQGMKVSVWESRRRLLPSIARIDDKTMKNAQVVKMLRPPHKVCACTMLWNQAAFLREWIMYHGYLGVHRWFLYDNNSDDNIEEVVESLGSFNVSRHIWPWIKTQEAGFSHCALRAREECEWVVFMDVDEFLYPIEYFQNESMSLSQPQSAPTMLQRLINNATSEDTESSRVGEIRIDCHSFGPSGLKNHPDEGVMAGYTCRLNRTERHKSIINLSALNQSLINVVHHFHLKRGYRYINLPRGFAVINHYKYQVWDTFKAKFFRRVATYVTDWQESQNESSKDRAPGLGTEPIEPQDWSEKFCEVSDTGLRNFTLDTFTDPATHLLLWQ